MVLKFESLEPGLSGSLEESSGSTQYTPSTDNGLRTTVDGFVDTLKLSGLSGPVLLSGRPERIGEGGQFYVSKQEVVFLERDHSNHSVVAIKRPKYPLANSFPIDLANPQVERNLKHVSNEIRALSNERLRYHPNIVKLLSWAWDVDYSRSLVLVLELAREDLESALAADPPPNLFLRVRFCSDVANGLDAIHDANLVHGDLKPANVLIFFETFRPVAKLADFGYSVGQSDCVITGTAGWQAPEKKASVPADCFSYGLLIWSTLLLDGQIPNHAVSQSWMDAATADLEVRRDDLPREVFVRALDSMKSLLDADPARRRCHLGAFFASTTELKQQEHERIEITNHDPHAVYNFAASRFTWEIEPLPRSLLKSLYRRFRDTDGGSQDITPDRRLAVALHFTRDLLTTSEASEDILQILLEAAARRGNVAACALLPKVSSRAGVVYDNSEVMEWLTTAIISGSLSARDDLQKLDAAAATKAVRCFEERGGYNMAYWDLDQITQPPSLIDANDTSQLHWLSAFGTIEQLRIFLDENPGIAINSMSERQETALYLACLRGSWEHVRTLLENNADPSIKCTTSGITCLHWTIAFDKGVCKLVVRSLVEAGADVNALTSLQQETPFPHYPFVLPSGAPLHWAATTSSNEAIQALVEQGASALLRNSCDPYMYDDRVRWLYAVGGPDSEGCTFPESNCLGLSSLDVAAIHRDPFLFRHLARESAVIDMNSADEEGFAVLHRLATNQTFRTSRRVAYSPRPIRSIKDVEVLQSIITAVIDLGGNTEMLTSNAETAKRKTQRSTDPSKSSYTPLMLAMLEGDEDLVDALLACGASVHTQNLSGETALFHTSHRANAEQSDLIKCVQKLVFSGANVNHHSSNGNSALLAAAQSQLLEVFDFLLCNGANIDETDRKERTTTPGKSVFACFASTKNGSDEKMLELLEKHILDARNVAKKDRVITGTADDGRTLLHEFASQAMPKCVKFLLKHGARVNVPLRQTRFIVANPRSEGKRVWYETPWDIMKVSREFVQDNMLVRNTHSLQQTKDLLERWDRCKELLEEYGGGPCEKPEHYEAWP